MSAAKSLRNEVKKYIDTADEKIVKMIHAIIEVEEESDWWDDLSDGAKDSIQRGLKDADAGRVTPNEVVMKKYQKWLSK